MVATISGHPGGEDKSRRGWGACLLHPHSLRNSVSTAREVSTLHGIRLFVIEEKLKLVCVVGPGPQL